MGGLAPRMLVTTVTFLVGALGLSGVPPLAGFWSKDEILGAAFHEGHRVLWAPAVIGAFMTAFYTFRLVFLAFFGSSRMDKEVAHHVHESPAVMTVPLVVLAVLTVVAGFAVGIPTAHGTAFARFLAPVLPVHEEEQAAASPAHAHVSRRWWRSAASCSRGSCTGSARCGPRPSASPGIPSTRCSRTSTTSTSCTTRCIVQPIYRLSLWCARVFDLGVIDGIVNGVARVVTAWATGMRRIQTGFVMNYALGILIGAVAVVAFFLTR